MLAEQPKGYFVLNDIFRYIVDDEDEETENGQTAGEEATPAKATESEPATLTSSNDRTQQEHDAEQIDKKLEAEVLQEPSVEEVATDSAPANGVTSSDALEINQAEDAPVAAVKESDEVGEASKQAADAVSKEDEQVQQEKPRDPDPTPVASPARPAKAAPIEDSAPVAPAKPAAPKTWANLVAAPVVPSGGAPTSAANPAASQSKAGSSSVNQSVTPPSTARETSPAKGQQNGNSGWQMAGSDNNKKQGRQHGASPSVSGTQEVFLGYVKNVTDKVDASILKSTLSQYGKLLYFDVSRPKVCIFANFFYSVTASDCVPELCVCRVRRLSSIQCRRCCQPSFYRGRTNIR